jgi:peroxiredoxin
LGELLAVWSRCPVSPDWAEEGFTEFGSIGGKFVSSVLALLSISILGVFCFIVFRATRLLPASHGAPTVGQKAPDFTLRDTRGNLVSLSALLSSPPEPATSGAVTQGVFLIFYRGYWWPFCNSELRGIEEQLPAFKYLGIRPVAISVDAPEESADLCRKAGYAYTFLSDPNAEVIRRFDLLHPGAGVNGHDIARPAEFLLDSSGIVRWVNLTNDLRVRAAPEEMLKAAKALH